MVIHIVWRYPKTIFFLSLKNNQEQTNINYNQQTAPTPPLPKETKQNKQTNSKQGSKQIGVLPPVTSQPVRLYQDDKNQTKTEKSTCLE